MSETEMRNGAYLDVRGVADMARVPESVIRRMVSEGMIRHVRIGRVIRIPADEADQVLALVADQREGYSFAEVAASLNISELTISRAVDRGEIPATKKVFGSGGGRYITREVFEELCRGEAV